MSTAGVATFLGRDLGEESLGRLPPQHITESYVLTKWVGELLVEQFGVGLGGTVGAPELDVVSSVMQYSAQLGAVPTLKGYDGCVQLVSVEEVARGIVDDAVAGSVLGQEIGRIPASQYFGRAAEEDMQEAARELALAPVGKKGLGSTEVNTVNAKPSS